MLRHQKQPLLYNNYEMHKLLDWIDPTKLNWSMLSANPKAIHLLEQNLDKIDWWIKLYLCFKRRWPACYKSFIRRRSIEGIECCG